MDRLLSASANVFYNGTAYRDETLMRANAAEPVLKCDQLIYHRTTTFSTNDLLRREIAAGEGRFVTSVNEINSYCIASVIVVTDKGIW